MIDAAGKIPDMGTNSRIVPGKVIQLVSCRKQIEKKSETLSEKNCKPTDSRPIPSKVGSESNGLPDNVRKLIEPPHGFGEALSWLWEVVLRYPFGKA